VKDKVLILFFCTSFSPASFIEELVFSPSCLRSLVESKLAICRFNAIPNKIPILFYTDIGKTIPKFTAKTILSKKQSC
jgi:hypothetical protein